MNQLTHKKEIILIAAILAAAGILYIGNRVFFSKPARQAEISVDGKVVKTLDLNRNGEFLVDGFDGGTNLVVVKDGQVCVKEASCPDKVCVHQGSIHQSGDLIVCLPNRVIVQITGE